MWDSVLSYVTYILQLLSVLFWISGYSLTMWRYHEFNLCVSLWDGCICIRRTPCMYLIGDSVIVMVTLVECSSLVTKLIMGMCGYLQFKFAGWLLVCVCTRSELVTEVCTEEQVVMELCALCQCFLELAYRILHLVWLYICHLSGYYSWFQTSAVFWMMYAFFWLIPQRLNFIYLGTSGY